MSLPKIMGLVGPTGIGKTALALLLADTCDIEIVSVDSRQVYRGMDIGTGKPSAAELSKVRHHLVDIVDPQETFSLAEFLDKAYLVIEDIHGRGKLPFLVGGTGQYFWALMENWTVPRVAPDVSFRKRMEQVVEADGADALFSRLKQVDPDAADSLDIRNIRRVIRAMEIHHVTGVPWSKLQRRGSERFEYQVVGLTMDKPSLHERINDRIGVMIGRGWIREVTDLLETGVTMSHSSMASVGYRDLGSYLSGDLALEEALENIKRKTQRFARRQYNWFRPDDSRINWVNATNLSEASEIVRNIVAQFLR